MSKTVYIEVTSNYSRSDWDNSGTITHDPGDRVAYFDGSRNRIFVCINSNNSTTEPQNNPTDWAPAGSEEYPFLLIDSTNNLRVTTNSEWTLHGTSSSTVNFLVEELGTWTPDNPIGSSNGTYQADGAGGTIILGDGRYAWDYPTYAMWWPNNCTIQAKNKQKAYIIVNSQYWGGNNVTWKDVVFYNSQTTNAVPGSYLTGHKHNLDSCLSTQETPWGALAGAKQEPSSPLWTRTLSGSWNGGYIRGCTFDYQYIGPSYLFDLAGGTGAVFENNTFYIRVKNSQYQLLFNTGNIILKNNIFYIKYLQDGHGTQNLIRIGNLTEGENVFYLENDSDVDGTLTNNISGGVTIDPLFVDADNGNFSLRPSSPLIGGLSNQGKQSEVENQYPQGKWFDSNAAAGGDGSWETPYNNYGEAINSFTGDEAVILVKEGEHPLYAGFWNGSTWATSNDLTKVYSSGVKIIGMGKDSTFTAGSEVSGWPTFYSSSDSGAHNPNLIDTPFLLKDFTILLTSQSPYNRSLWTLRKGTMINVHVKPKGPGLGNSGANLFDYNMSSATGDYLHMSSCTIEVTFDTGNGNFCSTSGQKQFSNCTFIDPNHTRSSTTYPKEFLSNTAGNVAGSFIKDCIFYTKSAGFNNTGASNTLCQLLNTVFYSTQDELTLSSGTNKTNCAIVDPRFVNDNGYEAMDLRLRPDSPLIGGVSKSKYSTDSVWVQPGAGNGTGTEDDPFYWWDQYSEAFLAAVQSSSNQLVFKDGTYIWTSGILQDDNVGNNITMVAENLHQAIFTDNGSRMYSAEKRPTLRFKGIQLIALDHFTHVPECHYVFDSVHLLCDKQVGALSVTATGSIFEVATGANTYIFNNSGPVNIRNCIFADHNDRSPSDIYLTHANSGIIKNTIFYAKYPRADCINPGHSAILMNCASENIVNQQSGIEYFNNLGFIDVENKNYNLRPLSPLIGKGK